MKTLLKKLSLGVLATNLRFLFNHLTLPENAEGAAQEKVSTLTYPYEGIIRIAYEGEE